MNNGINKNIHRDIITWEEDGGTCFEIRTDPKPEKISWWKKVFLKFKGIVSWQ